MSLANMARSETVAFFFPSYKMMTRLKIVCKVLPVLIVNPLQARYLVEWRRAYRSSPLEDEQPWITFSARRWLDEIVTNKMIVFEYGSGGSTLYFAKRVKRLVSVEHDPDWHSTVSRRLMCCKAEHVDYFLRIPERVAICQSADSFAARYQSRRFPDTRASFVEYVRTIEAFPDRFFDVIFIDGRARNACAVHALPKVKVGGFLVLDNSERIDYGPTKRLLRGLKQKVFGGICPYGHAFWKTSAWQVSE